MFNDSKYTKTYFKIIENAKIRTNENGYYEKHHIIPRSCGGTNEHSNLIILTAKEHFVCHLLLTKMCLDKLHRHKMICALNNMTKSAKNHKRYTGRLHESFRSKFSKSISELLKDKPKSETHRKNISISKLGSNLSKETKQKISNSLVGKTHSEETKQKISDANKFSRPYASNNAKSYIKKLKESGTNHPMCKTWQVTTPSGETLIVTNLKSFCKEHNISNGNLSTGKTKGFTAVKLN